MAIVNNVNEVLHRVCARLYHSYQPGTEGCIARTDDESSLDIEEICAALKN